MQGLTPGRGHAGKSILLALQIGSVVSLLVYCVKLNAHYPWYYSSSNSSP